MSTTQWLVLGIIIVIIGGVIIYGMGGFGGDGGDNTENGGSTKPASLSDPVMSLSVDMTSAAPTEPTDVFHTDTPVIYCTVRLADGSAKTRVKGEWIYLGSGPDSGDRDKIYETEGTFSGSRYIAFSLTDDAGWKVGAYEVILYLDKNEKFRVPFTVE
jgi:hypothetical protein